MRFFKRGKEWVWVDLVGGIPSTNTMVGVHIYYVRKQAWLG